MKIRECIETKFELVNKDYTEQIIKWLQDALGILNSDELTDREIESICDRHWESSESKMFDWIHDSDNESPTDIFNSSWVTELDNVLVLDDGSCYFWYDI